MATADQKLGVVYGVVVLGAGAYGVVFQDYNIVKAAGVMTLIGLTGVRYVQTGWRAQAKSWLARANIFVGEGLHWFPLPYTLPQSLRADCRDVPMKIDSMELMTGDGQEVRIPGGEIVWRVFDLGLRNQMAEESDNSLLDEIVDQAIRRPIQASGLREVLKMEFGCEKANEDLARWGVEVLKIVIPGIKPTNPDTIRDLGLPAREMWQQEGETIENHNVIERVAELVAAGYSHKEAAEQVQMTVNKAGKNFNVLEIIAEPNNATTLAALVGGIKGGGTK